MSALWTLDAMAAAMRAEKSGALPAEVPGLSIDTRSIGKGEAFFAITGDNRDGHDFVETALKSGAGLAVVASDKRAQFAAAAPLLIVADVLEALCELARAARARSRANVIAVTGSVGKTSTKEALLLALSADGETHASAASYNNHWGVPLSLARCPASAKYAVVEIGMAHADLEPRVFGARRTSGQRKRHAPVIVVGGGGSMGLAVGGEREEQGLLGAGLADRTGDGDHVGARASARGGGEFAQSLEHVRDDQQRRSGGKLRALIACDHGKHGAGFERGLDEVVAVAIVARDGEEGLALADASRIDGQAGHLGRQRAGFLRAHGGGHGVEGPQRAHATLPCKASATASWSENFKMRSPIIWPVSWPLPAISRTSPACSAAIALRIASARSPISVAPGAAARMAARIAAGGSLRGLSSVTMTRR